MAQQQGIKQILVETASRRNKTRQIQKLASNLRLSLSIPNDQTLVFALGHGRENTNEEALVNWLTFQLQDELEFDGEIFHQMRLRLVSQLLDYTRSIEG